MMAKLVTFCVELDPSDSRLGRCNNTALTAINRPDLHTAVAVNVAVEWYPEARMESEAQNVQSMPFALVLLEY
jgi:hypothetical protein